MRNIMYRWYVDGGLTYLVYPDDVNIEYTMETGQRFFREKLGSKLVFLGMDYEYVMQQIAEDFGHKFEVVLKRSDDGGATWYDYHKGQFHATDCVINTDDKKITVQPDYDDAYTEIMAGLDKEYNLVEITDEVESVTLTKRPLLQAYVLGDTKVTCMLSGMVWEQDAMQEYDDEKMVDHYNFNLDSIHRELNVTGTGLPAADDVYLGTLSYNSAQSLFVGTLLPKVNNGYKIDCIQLMVGGGWIAQGQGIVSIIRMSDNEEMYRYEYTYKWGEGEDSDNIDFTFIPKSGTGSMYGSMVSYRLYTRILCDVESYDGVATKEVPQDDIVPNNRNYRRCTMNSPMMNYVMTPVSEKQDGYYNMAGEWVVNTGYACWSYAVIESKTYYFSGRHNGSGIPFLLWYNSNRELISVEPYGVNDSLEYVERMVISPEGAAYLYLNVDNTYVDRHKVGYYFKTDGRIGYISGELTDTPTPWGRTPDGRYYVKPPIQGVQLNPIARTLWRYTSLWVMMLSSSNEDALQKTITLRDAYSLTTTIKALLAQVAPRLTFDATTDYSQFLFGTNPIVEGEEIGTIYITQKTNLLRGEYSQPAMNAPITLGTVLDMLRKVYDLYWFIDGNKLRIEHVSWFDNGKTYTGDRQVGADLTMMVNPRNGRAWAYLTGEWQYSRAEMSERYEYEWMDESTDVFRGKPIDVVGTFVERGKIEEVSISNFNADIDYILMNPSNVSEDGFAVIAAVNHAVPVISMTVDGQVVRAQNGRMSMVYVQPRYLIYNMPSWELKVNGEDTEAKSIMKGRTQQVKVPCGRNDLDMMKLVRTEIGDGEITKVTMPLLSRVAKVTLGYPTYELNE